MLPNKCYRGEVSANCNKVLGHIIINKVQLYLVPTQTTTFFVPLPKMKQPVQKNKINRRKVDLTIWKSTSTTVRPRFKAPLNNNYKARGRFLRVLVSHVFRGSEVDLQSLLASISGR